MDFIVIALLIFSAILHEFMHGWVAYNLGDPTAKLSGRLTLNPIPHLDPFGSLLIPLLLILSNSHFVFAYAKPVPINPLYFKNFKRDTLLTAMAGPLTNLSIALIFILFLKMFFILGGDEKSFTANFLFAAVLVNIILTVFNLLPIPPLDGSKVYYYLFSDNKELIYNLERYGFIILLVFLIFFSGIIFSIVNWITYLFFNLFGLQPYLSTFLG